MHTMQTPISHSSTGNNKPKVSGSKNIDLLQKAVEQELEGCVFRFGDSWVHEGFKGLASSKAVEGFIATTSLFDSKAGEWIGFKGATAEEELYEPIQVLGNSVCQALGGASTSGPRMRQLVLRDKQRMDHIEASSTTDYTMPDIVIEASGPSFQRPPVRKTEKGKKAPPPKHLGYTNISSFIEVKLSLQAPTARETKLTNQMGVYARYELTLLLPSSGWILLTFIFCYYSQVLSQQCNRIYVRALVITSDHCIVFHFDRSGAHISPPFNIHESPETFVRVLLAITSLSETVLGLDTSIQWNVDDDGQRTGGSIIITSPRGVESKYKLVKNEPESRRYTIRGRGTTCWRARLLNDEDVESPDDVIIKFSWQSDGRLEEYRILEEVKGLKGVGQMVARGRNGKQTKDWRAEPKTGALPKGFKNRTHTCVVLEGYGQSITFFEGQIQLLEAFRDIISGKSIILDERGF